MLSGRFPYCDVWLDLVDCSSSPLLFYSLATYNHQRMKESFWYCCTMLLLEKCLQRDLHLVRKNMEYQKAIFSACISFLRTVRKIQLFCSLCNDIYHQALMKYLVFVIRNI
jgi:hypothetical protein